MSKCAICGLSGSLPCGCTTDKDEIDMTDVMQKVWHTMSELPNGSGYVVWDVREVMGETSKPFPGIMPSADGGQIYVSISHTFDLKAAVELLFDKWAEYENLFVVHSKVNGLDWHGPVK